MFTFGTVVGKSIHDSRFKNRRDSKTRCYRRTVFFGKFVEPTSQPSHMCYEIKSVAYLRFGKGAWRAASAQCVGLSRGLGRSLSETEPLLDVQSK